MTGFLLPGILPLNSYPPESYIRILTPRNPTSGFLPPGILSPESYLRILTSRNLTSGFLPLGILSPDSYPSEFYLRILTPQILPPESYLRIVTSRNLISGFLPPGILPPDSYFLWDPSFHEANLCDGPKVPNHQTNTTTNSYQSLIQEPALSYPLSRAISTIELLKTAAIV